MTITPTELTEIERKARACQAEEAANPEAKTCHRPTPELVLRLVEEIKEDRKHVALVHEANERMLRRMQAAFDERDELRKEKDAWKDGRRQGREEALAILIAHNGDSFMTDMFESHPIGDTGDYGSEWQVAKLEGLLDTKQADSWIEHLQGKYWEHSGKIFDLESERDELRAKADQLREQNAGMGVELLGKDDTIKELRAKVAELEEKIKSSGVQSAMDAGMHTDEKGTVWTAPTAWSYAMACKARDNHQQSAYEANVKSMELQAIVDRLPKTADGVPIIQGDEITAYVDYEEYPGYCSMKVTGIYLLNGKWRIGTNDSEFLPSECYSTREAALAAQKGGGQ